MSILQCHKPSAQRSMGCTILIPKICVICVSIPDISYLVPARRIRLVFVAFTKALERHLKCGRKQLNMQTDNDLIAWLVYVHVGSNRCFR
eukprot:scaffold644798_cov39-Prasinocladus_malaysianus.AAC.1